MTQIQGRDADFTRDLKNRPEMPTRHVLIVEDDIAWQLQALRVFLRIYGGDRFVQVSIACGGQPAASLLSFSNAGVDLVLVDHDMPHGNGVEFLRWFRAGYPTVPVITFSHDDEKNESLMAAGANFQGNKNMLADGKLDGPITAFLRIDPLTGK